MSEPGMLARHNRQPVMDKIHLWKREGASSDGACPYTANYMCLNAWGRSYEEAQTMMERAIVRAGYPAPRRY